MGSGGSRGMVMVVPTAALGFVHLPSRPAGSLLPFPVGKPGPGGGAFILRPGKQGDPRAGVHFTPVPAAPVCDLRVGDKADVTTFRPVASLGSGPGF